MKTKLIASVLLVIACLMPVFAASSGQDVKKPQDPCKEAATQSEMTMCARKAHEAADAELNKIYNGFAAKLDEEQRKQLKDAELAWIKYRDTTCEFEGAFYKGGTMRPMIYSYCLERVTKERTAELKLQLEIYEQ